MLIRGSPDITRQITDMEFSLVALFLDLLQISILFKKIIVILANHR